MTQIRDLLDDKDIVALSLTQELEPMEGWEVPLFPATYPASDKGRRHRHDTPYNVNELKDGTLVATLDSVQSQANRLEAVFHGELQRAVPQVSITAGERTLQLTELPHRLADAAIRASDLREEIRTAFEAYAASDPLPIAKLGPTALIFGAWDSRDTRVKIPRLLRSEIHAWDVDVFTRSAQFSGSFSREELGFTEKEWKEGAEMGFAPTPSVDQHGGVLVRGGIRQTATLHLGAVRQLETAAPGLGVYALGLALGAMWTGGRDYTLRTGCWLIPKGPARVEAVCRQGEREPVELTTEAVLEFLDSQALDAAKSLEVPLGAEQARAAQYDPAAGKKLLKKAKED